MKTPKWNDNIDKWVGSIIETGYDEDERQHYMRRWDTAPAVRLTVTLADLERAAIDDFERGHFHPLTDLFVKGHNLGPKARAMIAAKLRGTFKLKTRRPKLTIQQREAKREYWANKEVDLIVDVLKRFYPKQKGHTDRAIGIAARRAGVTRRALESYRKSL